MTFPFASSKALNQSLILLSCAVMFVFKIDYLSLHERNQYLFQNPGGWSERDGQKDGGRKILGPILDVT